MDLASLLEFVAEEITDQCITGMGVLYGQWLFVHWIENIHVFGQSYQASVIILYC